VYFKETGYGVPDCINCFVMRDERAGGGCFEHSNEPSGSRKRAGFLEKLTKVFRQDVAAEG
jgi:hypothetical protein